MADLNTPTTLNGTQVNVASVVPGQWRVAAYTFGGVNCPQYLTTPVTSATTILGTVVIPVGTAIAVDALLQATVQVTLVGIVDIGPGGSVSAPLLTFAPGSSVVLVVSAAPNVTTIIY